MTPLFPRESSADNAGDDTDRMRLKNNMPGSGDDCIEETFASEESVLDTTRADDIHPACITHRGEIARINHHLLSGRQVVLYRVTIDFDECDAVS